MGQDADWMEHPGRARRKGKDSVYLDLFHNPRYGIRLVQSFHPEMELTESDIEYLSLHSVLMAELYNDLGILVKDRLILCSEAQSTWSLNVLVRMFLYLAETYHRYIQKHEEMNIYGAKKIILPMPECYVIYTGSEKNRPEFLSLSEEFFGKDSPLELRVKVITKPGTGNIVEEYIRFCHVFNEQVRHHGYTRHAIEETIRACRSENVLADYLQEREKEVETIMMTLFSQEEATRRYGIECRKEGREEGNIRAIHNLMETMSLTAEKAMDALRIPPQEREHYAEAIKSM